MVSSSHALSIFQSIIIVLISLLEFPLSNMAIRTQLFNSVLFCVFFAVSTVLAQILCSVGSPGWLSEDASGCDESYMNTQVFNRLLESQDVWILFLISVLIVVCMIEELLYEHTHPLCLVCIVDGLLYQKLYDPLFFVVEEYLYIPLCLIGEEFYDVICESVVHMLRLLRLNDG